jgi:hypothetical protein
MKLRFARKSSLTQYLAMAGGLLIVLLNSTPAFNLTYRYTDSKGIIHINNFSLPKSPEADIRHASLAANPAADSTAEDSGRISRVTDRQGTIRISNAAGSTRQPLALVQANKQNGAPQAVGPSVGTKAQSRIYDLIAKSAGAGSEVSQPEVAKVALMGGTGANSGATGIFTPLEPSSQFSLAQAEMPNSISPMSLCVDQQGKMYYYHPQVVAGDDSFWNAPIISWEKPTNQDDGGITVRAKAAMVSQALPAAPVSLQYRKNSLAAFRRTSGSSLPVPGKIHTFRDGRGIMHIINNAEIKNNFIPQRPPESLISAISCSWAASSKNLSAVMLPPGTSKIISNCPGGLNPGFSHILSRKDASGRLIICNRQEKTADCLPSEDLALMGENGTVDLETVMAAAAQRYRLPLPLVKAIVRAESGFVPRAISWKGAMGLMQLMPATAACLGVKDPFCPQQNIMGGCRYFRDLLDKLNGSVPLSLAAYNAGLQRVINAGYGIPAIAETQNFVEKVIKYFFIYAQQNYPGSKI